MATGWSFASSASRPTASKAGSSGYSTARTRQSSDASTWMTPASASSCPSTEGSSPTCKCRRGSASNAEPVRWWSWSSPAGRRRAGAARPHHRGARRIDAPGVDTEIIIRKHGIPDVHGDEAIDEARASRAARSREATSEAAPTSGRSTTVTIDGEHARDFDDAITIERLPNGHYWLGVHIADVVALRAGGECARRGSLRARHVGVLSPSARCTCFPSELATGLCSLNPHVDRLVQSCLMEVTPRRGRALRDARRRDQQRRADDLHRRSTRSSRTAIRERTSEVRAAGADVRADARAVRDPQRAAAAPRLDRLRSARSRKSSSTTAGIIEAIIAPSATSRTG